MAISPSKISLRLRFNYGSQSLFEIIFTLITQLSCRKGADQTLNLPTQLGAYITTTIQYKSHNPPNDCLAYHYLFQRHPWPLLKKNVDIRFAMILILPVSLRFNAKINIYSLAIVT